MAQRAVMSLRSMAGAVMLAGVLCLCPVGKPVSAAAAKTVGPQDLTRAVVDPLEKLVGVWRVVRVEGQAPSAALVGRRLRIDRDQAATLTQGICINPRFAETLGSFTITCLGQPLAVAAWDPQRPGTIRWTEGGFAAVLKRISGTEALPAGN